MQFYDKSDKYKTNINNDTLTLLELNINLQLFITVIIRILLIKFPGSSRVTKLLYIKMSPFIFVSYAIIL